MGFIAVGANSKDESDSLNLFVIKINKQGELLWTKSYFEAFPYSHGYDIVSAYDEGYIVIGNFYEMDNNSNDIAKTLILKISESGDSLYVRNFYIVNDNNSSIIKHNNYYFISSGNAILVVNNYLFVEYVKGLHIEAVMTKLHIINNNAYLAYGYTNSNTSFLMKFDNESNLIWEKEYMDIVILSTAEHVSDFFATGFAYDQYFNKILFADINDEGILLFSNIEGTSSDINFERIGKQVHYLNDNTFAIWENYNENKLKIYTVDENGEKVTE